MFSCWEPCPKLKYTLDTQFKIVFLSSFRNDLTQLLLFLVAGLILIFFSRVQPRDYIKN